MSGKTQVTRFYRVLRARPISTSYHAIDGHGRVIRYADPIAGRGRSLEITISSRHTDLSDALVATTRKKLSRLSRFGGGLERAEVHFYEEQNPRITDREVCEVMLDGNGHQLRCKVSAPDGFIAVDRAVEKLEHQLHKLKSRQTLRKTGT